MLNNEILVTYECTSHSSICRNLEILWLQNPIITLAHVILRWIGHKPKRVKWLLCWMDERCNSLCCSRGSIANSTLAYPHLSSVYFKLSWWRRVSKKCNGVVHTTSTFWVKTSNGEIVALCQVRVLDQGWKLGLGHDWGAMVPTPARRSNNKFGKRKERGKEGNTCRRLARVCRLGFLSILRKHIYNLQWLLVTAWPSALIWFKSLGGTHNCSPVDPSIIHCWEHRASSMIHGLSH